MEILMKSAWLSALLALFILALSSCTFIYNPDDKPAEEDTAEFVECPDGSSPDTGGECPDDDRDGWSVADGDCDDNDASNHPEAEEVCDGQDNDCDGGVDEEYNWFADADADGYGDEATETFSCSAPDGYIGNAGDCNDADPLTNPDSRMSECNGIDYDCDELVSDFDYYYRDADGDGWGDGSFLDPRWLFDCADPTEIPDGYVDNGMDCDDSDATINPASGGC